MEAESIGKLILRIAVGVLMLLHGLFKATHGIAWLPPVLSQHGLPEVLAYGIYLAEIAAPILLIIGLWTRLAGLLIVFDMLMAIILVHKAQILSLNDRSGGSSIELEAFFLLGGLALCFLGSGRYSISGGRGGWD